MYLRLQGAGIFYKVLNTPERIDVIEKMGHLDREDADFLREAATFYRAIDHGQRVASGHAEGSLPTSQAQFEMLAELVRRWTPEHLHEQRLDRDAAARSASRRGNSSTGCSELAALRHSRQVHAHAGITAAGLDRRVVDGACQLMAVLASAALSA